MANQAGSVIARIESRDLKRLGSYDALTITQKNGVYVGQRDGLKNAEIIIRKNQSYTIYYSFTTKDDKQANLKLRLECELSAPKLFLQTFPAIVNGKYAFYNQSAAEQYINSLAADRLAFLSELDADAVKGAEISTRCKAALIEPLKARGLGIVGCTKVDYVAYAQALVHEQKESLEQKLAEPKKRIALPEPKCELKRAVDAEKLAEIDAVALLLGLKSSSYTATETGEAAYEGWKAVLIEAWGRGCDDFANVRDFLSESEIERILRENAKPRILEVC